MFTHTFKTAHSILTHQNGNKVEILQVITEPDDYHDAEVLPMFRVRSENGEEFESFEDELTPINNTN